MAEGKVRVPHLKAMKQRGEKIAMLTAYDYPTARILDRSGIDVILVGDSLGMVVLGYRTTLPVTLEDVLRHTRAVTRAVQRALVVADMPFMSYGADVAESVRHAGRLMQEGGADAVKLEGAGPQVREIIRRATELGIPVMGHLGLTPQSVHQLGGYRVQGTTPEAADRLVAEARMLEEAGCFAVVLELMPAEVAARITQAVSVPTIGIGAGPHCDGQVLVFHDMVGLTEDFRPRFVKRYAELGQLLGEAVARYVADVRAGCFPGPEHSFGLLEETHPGPGPAGAGAAGGA